MNSGVSLLAKTVFLNDVTIMSSLRMCLQWTRCILRLEGFVENVGLETAVKKCGCNGW